MRNTQSSRGTREKISSRIAPDKEVGHIVVTPGVGTNTSGPTSSLNDMTSLEPNKAAAPSGKCSKRFFQLEVESDEGLDLVVDLDTTLQERVQNYSLLQTGSDANPLVASRLKIKIVDFLEEAQHEDSIRIEHVKKPAIQEDIGCADKSPFAKVDRLKNSIENEEPAEIVAEEDIDCSDRSPVCGGSKLTPGTDKHESPMTTEPQEDAAMEEVVGCDDKLPDSCQVATDFSLEDLTPPHLASGGMSDGGGGNGAVVEEEEVVHMEEAVELLVEYLVRPELPRRAGQDARHMTPEKQRAVAQQVHTAIILYNYYHRKRFPQLAFADAERFFICASLSVGEDLLPYLSIVHAHHNNSGSNVSLSVTDREAVKACEIARELSASQGYPDVGMWPIAKVAVLLLDPTKKKCLVEYGADTKGVWSIIEKEYDAAASISHSTNQPAGQESTNKTTLSVLDGPLVLQQLAISEVQRRTGMEASDLLVLDNTLAYSLSKERTTTKLFIVEYRKTMKGKPVEMSLEELISSMTGPVVVNDPFLKPTSVVEYYHILPYKEILEGLLHRKWPAVPQHGLHSVIDEQLEEQDENSMSKMRKQITKVSPTKQNKQAIKANQNSSIIKHKKSSKRKAEASRATAEGPDGESPIRENESIIVPDVETSVPMTKSINTKATAAVSGGPLVPHSGGQMDKIKGQKQHIYENMPLDIFPPKARYVEAGIENSALEPQNMEVTGKPGGVTENNNDQMYDSVQSIKKIRDEILRKQFILQERSIQCDMDIQTILKEGKMTPKALSIVDKYKGTFSNMTEVANSSCSGDGVQTMRKRLKEALNIRNKCQELDEICNVCEWILPRYTILPSVSDEMFRASVHLTCPDFDMSIIGSPRPTPHESRCSAAANMIVELQKKAEEE